MALLHDIQAELLDQNVGVGSILYKVRFLASKLEVDVLEDWVRHEANGYPQEIDVPDYRMASVSYRGTFTNGVQILNQNAIAPYIIEKVAGKHWTSIPLRDSLSVIDKAVSDEKAEFGIDAANLKLLLDNKVYQGFSCIEVSSHIDTSAFVRVQHAVRSRLLDFTLELEKKVPASAAITVGQPSPSLSSSEKQAVTQITNVTVMGDLNQVQASGSGAQITFQIAKGDTSELLGALTDRGIPEEDAKMLAEAIEAEVPEAKEGLGPKTKAALKTVVAKAASEGWDIGKSVIVEVVKQAAKGYWGLS